MEEPVRIGTRKSPLALFQAKHFQQLLAAKNVASGLVYLESVGDVDQSQPLHKMQTVGVFTKVLDYALLNDSIDIAVHSCKDLPTISPEGITLAAYVERATPFDCVVTLHNEAFFSETPEKAMTIATGSLRRKAQWLGRYPNSQVVGLRGNVGTRLQKLKDNKWDGAIFAEAGLKRLGIEQDHVYRLDWMVPAPAQGIIAATCRTNDSHIVELLQSINNSTSEIAAVNERTFLNLMEGGCSAPIGAYCRVENGQLVLTISVASVDGKEQVKLDVVSEDLADTSLGKAAFDKVTSIGADKIIADIKANNE